MVVKKSDPVENNDSDDEVETVNDDPLSQPGFHVLASDSYVGTYPTHEDAQAYIDGHLKPQDISAEIVEGPQA